MPASMASIWYVASVILPSVAKAPGTKMRVPSESRIWLLLISSVPRWLWGEREDIDGYSGDDLRIQMSLKINCPR